MKLPVAIINFTFLSLCAFKLPDPFSNMREHLQSIKLIGISESNSGNYALLSCEGICVIVHKDEKIKDQWKVLEITHTDVVLFHESTNKRYQLTLE